jgi:hypothetical protein
VSAYQACALRTDDSVTCWGRGGGETFAPTGSFATISGDYDQTCGVTTDGGIVCWERDDITLEQTGPFASVGTNRRVCALSAEGYPTCWDPYPTFVDGPFLQVFPDVNQAGCGHRLNGALVCLGDSFNFVSEVPPAQFRQVSIDQSSACGLRPDGRVVYFSLGSSSARLGDRVFIDVAADFDGCCGLSETGRVYCSDTNKPQEEE